MKSNKWIFGAAAAVAVYIAIVVASGLGWNPLGLRWNFENTGQFGDSFGPLSTLMAALAAIGAIGAYFAQREELEEAKKRAESEKQNAIKRDFEATFFRMIELLRDVVKEMEVKDRYGSNPVKGRDALERILNETIGRTTGSDEGDAKKFQSVFVRYRDELGHYFRLFYHIVKFIDTSDIKNKKLYVRILRATLSNAEIVLLGLNCVYGEGRSKFKPLVERYKLLHNISESDARMWRFPSHYSPKAFGDRSKMLI